MTQKEVKGKNLPPPHQVISFQFQICQLKSQRDVEIVAYRVRSQGTLAHFDKENASSEENLLCDSFPLFYFFIFFRISENFPTVGVPKLIQFVCIYMSAQYIFGKWQLLYSSILGSTRHFYS